MSVEEVRQMSDEEILDRIVELGFGGDWGCYEAFREKLRSSLPPKTEVALRGSVITNEQHSDGGPFDDEGPGTSDLDVTLIGDQVLEMWNREFFYLPRLHTKPLDDEHPDAAPELEPLREELQRMVGRPVNFQASRQLVQFSRGAFLNQPYFKIIRNEDDS